MKLFEDLAHEVAKKWSETNQNVSDFPKIATSCLQDFRYTQSLDQLNRQISDWLLASTELPKQLSLHNSFGQPSLTIFNDGKFVVDLYIWVDFDTSIHSHGFRGAFRVLHGQSLHETFKSKTLKDVASDIRFVDMSEIEIERLNAGETRTIAPGVDLTHRVIHLENPTITLCVRTVSDTALKQWTYLSTGLAVQKNEVDEALTKKVYFFQFLFERDQSSALQFLDETIAHLGLSSQIHLYESIASGALDLKPHVAQAATELVVSKYQWADWWAPYEESHMARMNGLFFEGCQSVDERLVAHFMNSGYKCERLKSLTGLSAEAIKSIAEKIIDEPGIFNADISHEDRSLIKELLKDRQKVVPLHLKQFSQITLMRKFLSDC